MANRGAFLLSLFKRRRFPVAIILLCVRWYCKYGISYCDLAEMMSERGVSVHPSTIFRWVQRYALEIETRVRPCQGHRSGSWRVDETYVREGSVRFCEPPIGRVSLEGCYPFRARPGRGLGGGTMPTDLSTVSRAVKSGAT